MKRIAVTWTETTTYEVVIEVPDNYPESVDGCGYMESDSEESDWWQRVEEQHPTWPTDNVMSVDDRQLTNIELIKEQA